MMFRVYVNLPEGNSSFSEYWWYQHHRSCGTCKVGPVMLVSLHASLITNVSSTTPNSWLVVDLPLWKYESQMGFLFPIYGKKEGSKPPTRYCVCLTDLAKDLGKMPSLAHLGLAWSFGHFPPVKFPWNLWALAETTPFGHQGKVDHALPQCLRSLSPLVGCLVISAIIPADGLKEKYLKPPVMSPVWWVISALKWHFFPFNYPPVI
jgi:hypothetical protein